MGDTPNPKGIGEMLTSDAMVAEMLRRAENVLRRAESIAPEDSGEYKSRFRTESGVKVSAAGSARAYGRVVNDDDKARYLEYGTEHNPRFRTLGRALDAAGD